MARPICLRLLVHWIRAAASRTFWTAGRSRPIRMAMMAITTKSSISVKPHRRPGWTRAMPELPGLRTTYEMDAYDSGYRIHLTDQRLKADENWLSSRLFPLRLESFALRQPAHSPEHRLEISSLRYVRQKRMVRPRPAHIDHL